MTEARQARLCSKDKATGKIFKEQWRLVAEAELYLARRKSLEQSEFSKIVNWIEYE